MPHFVTHCEWYRKKQFLFSVRHVKVVRYVTLDAFCKHFAITACISASTMFGEWTEPYCLKCCGDIDSQILSCREEPSLLHHLASSHYFLGLLQIVPDQINLSANSSSKHHRIVLPVCPWGLAIQCVLDSAVCSRGIRKMCRKSTFCRSLTSDRNQPVFTCIHSSHVVIFFYRTTSYSRFDALFHRR